jgi:hypothetical protein
MPNDHEAMQARKRVYHKRLTRVIEGVAWMAEHDVPTTDDILEAQRLMSAEYMAAVRGY